MLRQCQNEYRGDKVKKNLVHKYLPVVVIGVLARENSDRVTAYFVGGSCEFGSLGLWILNSVGLQVKRASLSDFVEVFVPFSC